MGERAAVWDRDMHCRFRVGGRTDQSEERNGTGPGGPFSVFLERIEGREVQRIRPNKVSGREAVESSIFDFFLMDGERFSFLILLRFILR